MLSCGFTPPFFQVEVFFVFRRSGCFFLSAKIHADATLFPTWLYPLFFHVGASSLSGLRLIFPQAWIYPPFFHVEFCSLPRGFFQSSRWMFARGLGGLRTGGLTVVLSGGPVDGLVGRSVVQGLSSGQTVGQSGGWPVGRPGVHVVD